MDYLRNLGSAAVSSLVQKSGLNLPFTLGPKVASLDGICTLYDGTKKDDGSDVSIFEYDYSPNRNYAPLAKNALRKLRTTRHPDVLKFIDAVESDTSIHIVTERVRPLQAALDRWSTKAAQEKEDWLLWGLHRISVALAFVNESCASTHGNVRINSIFLSPSGEWKLGGFEVLSNPSDSAAVLYTMGGLVPDAISWAAPEIKKGGWSASKDGPAAAPDAYALGLLLNATFNPSHHPPPTSTPPHPPPAASSRGAIPTAIFPLFKKLLNPNPKSRLTAKGFLEVGMAEAGFFASNSLVKVCLGLDNFSVNSEADKVSLLRTLSDSVGSFPPEFAAHRILPSLASALEFGGASAAVILPLILQFGKNVPVDDYSNAVVAPLVKLFTSPDRGTRMALLDHLPEYADKLDKKTVDTKIYPNLQTGFSDTVALIREATVKSIILLSPKLSDRVLNNDLLKHLARMQQDPEASIRTNACILIGRLGPSLGYNTKRKVLVPAFSRALKDTFVHARVAGLMAFIATIDCFETEELAAKVIPSISPSLVDKEKVVRDQAFKAIELFVKKLETQVASMPHTVLPHANEAPAPEPAKPANSAAGAAGAFAGWAISSIGKRLAASDMQSTMNAAPGSAIDRPTSAPPPDSRIGNLNLKPSPLITSISAANSTVTSPAFPSHEGPMSRSKGLQLGASKVPASIVADEWAEEAATEAGQENSPWGADDLMDVNADQDDWSAFETAPAEPPKPVSVTTHLVGSHNGNPIAPIPTRLFAHVQLSKPTTTSPPSRIASLSPADDWGSADGWEEPAARKPSHSPAPASSMTKEEKAAEMARRKEERKQRIALLKEQKKNATAKP